MSVLSPGWLAKASLAIHITAEDHWRAYGASPVKVFLFAQDGTPQLVQFAQGGGPDAAVAAIGAHAERHSAVALVITAPATTTETHLAPDVFARTSLADLPTPEDVADAARSILTVTLWPERDLATALHSDIQATGTGAFELAPILESAPTDPSHAGGLIATLTGLLPRPGRDVQEGRAR